jgi:hypothetical protein
MSAPLSLEKFSDGELIAAIEEELANLDGMQAEWRKPHHAIKAQIYIRERSDREQRKQTRIMLRCTLWVTVMTVAIMVMTGVLLWKEFFPAH